MQLQPYEQREATEHKAALDVTGHNFSQPSPQQAKGATLPRVKSAGILGTPVSISSTPDTFTQTKSSSQSASTASLFRYLLSVLHYIINPTAVPSPVPKTPAKLFVLPDLSVRLFVKSRSSSSSSDSSDSSTKDSKLHWQIYL